MRNCSTNTCSTTCTLSDCSVIMAILQENRVETATKVQAILTEYGCHIRLRLGLHDAAMDQCSNTGLILLQVCGGAQAKELETKLTAIPYVRVNTMSLAF